MNILLMRIKFYLLQILFLKLEVTHLSLYARAFLAKLIIALTVTAILTYVTGITVIWGTVIALTLTLVTSLAADRPFLLLLGRNITVLVDVALAIPLIWGLTRFITGLFLPISTLAILTLVIVVGEWFFHIYAMDMRLSKDLRLRIKD